MTIDDDMVLAWLSGVDVVMTLCLMAVCIGYILIDFGTRRLRQFRRWQCDAGFQAATAILVLQLGGLWRSVAAWWMYTAYDNNWQPTVFLVAMLLLIIGKAMMLWCFTPDRALGSSNIFWRLWHSRFITSASVAAALLLPTVVVILTE